MKEDDKYPRSGNAVDEADIESCKELQRGTFFTIRIEICSDAYANDHTEQPRIFLINVLPKGCCSKWMVRRTYKNFLDLETFYRSTIETSEMTKELSFVLPDKSESNPALFEDFLQHLLFHVRDYLWRCPQILSFLDDTMNMPNIRDTQLAVLTKKIVDLTAGYNDLENKLYNTQHAWNCVSEKLSKLEKLHESYAENERNLTDQLVQNSPEHYITDANQQKSWTTNQCSKPGNDSAITAGISQEDASTDTKISADATPALSEVAVESDARIELLESADDLKTDENRDGNHPTENVDATQLSAKGWTSSEMGGSKSTSLAVDFEKPPSVHAESDDDLDDVSGVKQRSECTKSEKENSNIEEIVDTSEFPLDKLEESVPVPSKIHTYRNNRHLPISAMSERETPDGSDAAIAAIVNLLTPHDDQFAYRASAHAFLSRTVRNSLKAKLFETGLHALKSFLPDDPIRLTVLLWRGNSTNWLANLGDKLRCLAQPSSAGAGQGSAAGMGSNNSSVFDDDGFNEANGFDIDNEPKPTGEHTIGNINPSTINGHSRMHCTIDAVSVEIVPNGRSDICFLALMEEISQLVGKKDLFKRSLLLIRAWWTYEAIAYVDVSPKNFFSDPVLCVLVSSVFNQYHAVIHHPLQALSIFLAEYSDIKWGEVAITLQGVVPFHSTGILENQPWLREPLISELVTSSILQKHCDFYHMSSTSSSNSRASATPHVQTVGEGSPTLDNSHSSEKTPTSNQEAAVYRSSGTASGSSATTTFENTAPSSVSATPYGTGTVSTAATVAAAAVLLAGKGSGTAPKKPPSDSHCYSPTAVRNFQKRVINIVHPLTNANMISTSATPDRVQKICQIFETGACELHAALLTYSASTQINVDSEAESEPSSPHAPFEKFFKGTLLRFNSGLRPDLFKGSLPGFAPSASEESELGGKILTFSGADENDDVFSIGRSLSSSAPSRAVSFEAFFDQIRYMDLVLVGRVSESALLALSQDILVGRGVLPVGEIGKSLQDIAPTRNLSGKIKEKYGGLKKFLERYPEEVVICADHPFNPHVFLRKPLSAADLELIERGVIPPQLRKAMALRNKMRGGGTTIGALDGFNGPGSNSFSPGGQGQGQGQMGPANTSVSRQMNLSMSPSGLYSPHIGTNNGAMQSHIPAIGSRLPRNGAMIAQNQIFGQGQPMSHQAQNQVHIPCQVPVHTQLSHQQHLIQSYKPQMTQAHQLQISQNLGQGQGLVNINYRNEPVQGMPLQGNLSPRSQFSGQPHTPRSRDEMTSMGLMPGRGIAVNDAQSRSHSIPNGSFIMPPNQTRSVLPSHGHHQYPGPLRGNSDTGVSGLIGLNTAPIESYSPYMTNRDRRVPVSDRDREMIPLVLGDRNASHSQSQREAPLFGGPSGLFNSVTDASGRRRYSDLAPGGFSIPDGNRDGLHNNGQDRKLFDLFRNQSQETYRDSMIDGYREQSREQELSNQNDPFRDDISRDPDLSLNMGLPHPFGPPVSMRSSSLNMMAVSKAFADRDNVERMEREKDREFGVDRWRDNTYSIEAEERERARDRERYVDIDYGADVNCGLFSSKPLSSNQVLSDDSPLEFFDLRNQGGYQQSRSSTTKVARGSYFRDPDNSEENVGDDEEHQRYLIQKQQQGLGQRQDFPPAKNQFDPTKWV